MTTSASKEATSSNEAREGLDEPQGRGAGYAQGVAEHIRGIHGRYVTVLSEPRRSKSHLGAILKTGWGCERTLVEWIIIYVT